METGKSLQKRLKSYPGQLRGYALTEPIEAYLVARYGESWQRVNQVTIDAIGPPLLMEDFRPGIGCCTITALTAVFSLIQKSQEIPLLPRDERLLFDQIEALAARHGYRPKRGRTNPLRIGAIVRALFRRFGMSGQAGSVLCLPAHQIRRELDAGWPVLLNIAFGYYHRHTVAVVGYQLWQSVGPDAQVRRQNLLWLVQDGWSREVRLIDHRAFSRPWSGNCSVYSVTRIRPDEHPLHSVIQK